jgi:cytidine deaminase
MSGREPGPAVDWDALRRAAQDVARRAYIPYSRFPVGAAGLVDDGRVVVGCNVENASYGLTLCAECGLVSSLHATGGGRLVAVVVCDPDGQDLSCCGRCRQLLFEAGGRDLVVNGRTMDEWLPGAFGPDDLDTDDGED